MLVEAEKSAKIVVSHVFTHIVRSFVAQILVDSDIGGEVYVFARVAYGGRVGVRYA